MGAADLLCFSHLRWDSVYQRPHHLMARAARERRVFFVEEPIRGTGPVKPAVRQADGVTVVQPMLPDEGARAGQPDDASLLRAQLSDLFRREGIHQPWLWYYAPLALDWTGHLPRAVVVYDCMDELRAFRFAPPELPKLEQRLIDQADLVFTGGSTLYEAKRSLHPRTYLFPSSVDRDFFAQARQPQADPPDQAGLPRPRLGYFGVIDERLDLELVAAVAGARPDWQIVMVGPVLKVSADELPQAANLHWLGQKPYSELPAYLAGWDVALMPFAINEATRHISPTKTPEYLAGGRPVVSTPIADVVDPYGRLGLVEIASDAAEFVEGVERALQRDTSELTADADRLLAGNSWDRTWADMEALVSAAAERSAGRAA